MNWPHFILWTVGLYFLYYLAIVLFDLSRNQAPKDTLHELTFAEEVTPQPVAHLPEPAEKPKTKPDSPIIGSGGVSLKNLFNLCREEAVVYTRPVSF